MTKSKALRESILIEALLENPNVSSVAKKTHISRSTIYGYLADAEFQKKLSDARQEAVCEAISLLQSSLRECATVLVEIVRDEENAPQIRLNAINAAFTNVKVFQTEGRGTSEAPRIIIDDVGNSKN